MNKVLKFTTIIVLIIAAYFAYKDGLKILPFYEQLTQNRVGNFVDLQNEEQKESHFVGSKKCQTCHEDKHHDWSHSKHPKMVQDIKKNPSAVVADFLMLPKDADFVLADATYTVGSKFKQRFMIRKDRNGTEDYVLGNYQWNVQTHKWQKFNSWKYWYKDAYPHDNNELPTSRACDGCHFTGFMSRQKRIEPGIACEACHGPASKHIEDPSSKVYLASLNDPLRQNEVCLQCHMRNRDKRLEDHNISDIYKDARDYPLGYEAGCNLTDCELPAPFTMGHETKEFFANGAGKKNRTQGNEFVHSIKGKHGISCINCHNPHTLVPTAENNSGNSLCMKCHSFGGVIGPHQKNIEQHTHHKADSKGSLCVECHMPKTGKHTGKSPLTVRSHLFGFTTPNETIKYKMPHETNACYACHKERKKDDNDTDGIVGHRSMKSLQNDLESWGMVGWDKR